ncbi:MAG TPA: sugar phosphate isomerase/epimerase [Chitinophagaceae bacterium]|jgi:sugar phosphate isomerase/epimerase|nr:sugar phosphate isomerase/epimerase [Chitinophagaceae bacterium]
MKRKNFIQNMSMGAAALYANKLFTGFGDSKSLAVQLYTIREAVAKNLEGALEQLAGLGYKSIELYGYNGTFFGKSVSEFKTILANTGIKVLSSHHTTGIATKSKGTLSDGWDKAIEDIHALGAEYMVCAYLMPNERTPEIYKSLPAMFEKAATATKAAGIQFAYHNHDFEFEKLDDTLVYDFLIKNTSPDLVKMEMDLYWISKAGYDPVQYFDKYPGRFHMWHVKDMEAGTKAITEVGNGTIDFDRIFAARKKAGLKYWFVEQDTSKIDKFESLKISRDYLAKKNY